VAAKKKEVELLQHGIHVLVPLVVGKSMLLAMTLLLREDLSTTLGRGEVVEATDRKRRGRRDE
jgi:hypothetical protein